MIEGSFKSLPDAFGRFHLVLEAILTLPFQ